MSKKNWLIVASLTVVLVVTAIWMIKSKSQVEQVPKETQKYRIALVMKTLTNPFFVTMEKGARRAETDFGIQLVVKTGAQETSIEQQIVIVDQLILDKVDAIVIAPASSVELIPILKKAQTAGIAIVNIDNQLDPDICQKANLTNVPFISVDNQEGAYQSASYIAKSVTVPTEAAIIEGIRTAKNAQARKAGAIKAFKENPLIKLVAMETGEWKIDKGMEVTALILKQHPNVKLLFCSNDMMAIGAIQYLKDTNHKGIKVAAFDDLDEVHPLIKDGSLAVTINQQADQQGYEGVSCAVKLLKKETVNPLTIIPVKLINSVQ